MKTLPKPPEYNILQDWKTQVSKLSHDYQINWLRFEYVRRNPGYQKDYKEWEALSEKCLREGYREHNAFFEQHIFRTELLRKWEIIALHDPSKSLSEIPDSPEPILRVKILENNQVIKQWESTENEFLPEFGIPNQDNRCRLEALFFDDGKIIDLRPYHDENKYQIQLEGYLQRLAKDNGFEDREPTVIIQPLTSESFRNLPIKEQIERQFSLYNYHPLESFKIWKRTTQSGKEILEWDESTWQLIAINRKAGRKQLEKEFKKLVKKIPRKMTQKRIQQNVYYLRVWDLRQVKDEQGQDIYSNEDIKKDINLQSKTTLDRTKLLSKWKKRAEELINGGYRKIR